MQINLQSLVVGALSLVVIAGGGAAAVELQTTGEAVTVAAMHETPAQETTGVAAEPLTCLPQPEPAAASHAAEQQPGHTGVSFVVPPSTVIEVDGAGRPVSVSTNTGQAPCETDLFVQVGPDGTRTPAGEALRDVVLEQLPAGPWTPGVSQPLTAG